MTLSGGVREGHREEEGLMRVMMEPRAAVQFYFALAPYLRNDRNGFSKISYQFVVCANILQS